MKLSALFDTPVALWTLNRDGHTIVAEVHEIEGIGLELRYMRGSRDGVRLDAVSERDRTAQRSGDGTVRVGGARLDSTNRSARRTLPPASGATALTSHSTSARAVGIRGA